MLVRPTRLEVAGFALSFAIAGVLLAGYPVAGGATYASLAAPDGAAVRVNGAIRVLDRTALLGVHRATIAYALGEVDRLPDAPGTSVPLFDPDERSHMADVRSVFAGVRAVLAAALIVLAWRLVRGLRAGPRHLARLARDGAIGAAVLVGAVGVLAAVAFEPLFMAFHLVFFPQGNFLFDPATSNLLAIYPEPYWYGATLRVGLAFVVLAAGVAAGGSVALRRLGDR